MVAAQSSRLHLACRVGAAGAETLVNPARGSASGTSRDTYPIMIT
jgi:hypothetical protein